MYFVFYKPDDVVPLYAKVYLQGPYNTTNHSMKANLRGLSGFPTTQPYSGSPWSYGGGETVTTVPAGVVDWVLVELRSTYNGAAVSRRAAFLKSDGTIFDTGSVAADHVNFSGISPGNYYIVIKHRNHLAVISNTAATLTGGNTLTYDFTGGGAYGTNAMANLGGTPAKYGMWAGDADGNGQIQNSDKNSYWQVQVGLSGYQSADFNLNGQVQNNDKNSYWSVNVGLGTQFLKS